MTVTPECARRVFILKQHMDNTRLTGSFRERVRALLRDVGYIQWDPITVVAPSHVISLWSRIGNFRPSDLEGLMWDEKEIFLHWIPTAWLVPFEDYPVFYSLMKGYPQSLGKSWRSHIETAANFLGSHDELRKRVLTRLREGAADLKQFNGYGKRGASSDGWTSGNEVATMLHHLHMRGEVMVSGHYGNNNIWSLTDDFIPEGTERTVLSAEDLERATAERSIKALGIAPALDINRYYVRGRYWNLAQTLSALEDEGVIVRVTVDGQRRGKPNYIHAGDMGLIDSVENDGWKPAMKLVSPFDNIITVRERVRRLFGFDYVLEQFLPVERRRFGTYVLPVLWGDRLVGRIDASFDRSSGMLNIISVHAEAGFENDVEIPARLSETIGEFGEFLGAEKVHYGKRIPDAWRRFLTW